MNKNFTKETPGFEPGTSRTQAWNAAQWPIFKQFYYWFLARKNANLNLNNFNGGGAQSKLIILGGGYKTGQFTDFFKCSWAPPPLKLFKFQFSFFLQEINSKNCLKIGHCAAFHACVQQVLGSNPGVSLVKFLFKT